MVSSWRSERSVSTKRSVSAKTTSTLFASSFAVGKLDQQTRCIFNFSSHFPPTPSLAKLIDEQSFEMLRVTFVRVSRIVQTSGYHAVHIWKAIFSKNRSEKLLLLQRTSLYLWSFLLRSRKTGSGCG